MDWSEAKAQLLRSDVAPQDVEMSLRIADAITVCHMIAFNRFDPHVRLYYGSYAPIAPAAYYDPDEDAYHLQVPDSAATVADCEADTVRQLGAVGFRLNVSHDVLTVCAIGVREVRRRMQHVIGNLHMFESCHRKDDSGFIRHVKTMVAKRLRDNRKYYRSIGKRNLMTVDVANGITDSLIVEAMLVFKGDCDNSGIRAALYSHP